MQYRDLRDFIQQLEEFGELKRIKASVDPYLEMTEVCQRTLHANGPALLFENPNQHTIPVLGNLFGTTGRVALGMGCNGLVDIRELGKQLAFLKQPEPPQGWREAWSQLPLFKKILHMKPTYRKDPPCQEVILQGHEVDLEKLPIQTCWPGDVGKLITWGLVVTQSPKSGRHNLGIYRQQVIDRNKVIMRWLAHRGGALDFQQWQTLHPDKPFPIAVALGADPATTLAAVTPIPDDLSEYAFAGLLRGKKTELAHTMHGNLAVPAHSEIILEGTIDIHEMAAEGPFGDHTGYYNEVERFPVMTIHRITHREKPIYHSTYTGRPPDEPAILGVALNECFIPLIQKQFPEIRDFYLPPEGCSYRIAIVSINKQYAGHAKRIMMGVWSFLKQFMYTKIVIVTDDDIDSRNWQDVMWAISTRTDPQRDFTIIENTPIDYLDFASPISGLGSKVGIDATHKWPGETNREWGRMITMDPAVVSRIDAIWDDLNIVTKT